MGAIPEKIEIKVTVDTTELDEALKKAKELNELTGKYIKLQNQSIPTYREGKIDEGKFAKEDNEHRLANVAIARENNKTTIVLNGQKLQGVSSVSFAQKAVGLPILNLELICEQVSIDSPILMHIPSIYRSPLLHED